MKLFLATTNQGKLREFKQILQGLDIDLLSLVDFPKLAKLDVAETAQNFQGNALLKAKFFAEKTNLLTCADDSGLVVTALAGFPGVASNRWHQGSDQKKNQALLKKMQGGKNRQAAFQTVLCLYDPQKKQADYFTGEVRGQLALEARGQTGFGYDPIFIPDSYQKTFAELGLEVKNKLSHRAKAIKKLKKSLFRH